MKLVLLFALVPTLLACDQKQGASPAEGGTPSAARPGPDLSKVDVCALVTPAEIEAVVRGATEIQAKPEPSPGTSKACRYTAVSSPNGPTKAEIVLLVTGRGGYTMHKAHGKPIADLGDEAVDSQGKTVVLVGDLMLTTRETNLDPPLVVALFRKAIPRLR